MDGRQTRRHRGQIEKRGQGLGCPEEWQGGRQAAQDRYSGGSWRFLSRFKTRKLEKSNRRSFDFAALAQDDRLNFVIELTG